MQKDGGSQRRVVFERIRFQIQVNAFRKYNLFAILNHSMMSADGLP